MEILVTYQTQGNIRGFKAENGVAKEIKAKY